MTRIGTGYDTHPLVEGRPLVLGGVTILFERGLDGHSDSDVVAHAIVDALLGAAGLGDIGTHFPASDPANKDANSLLFLERTAVLLREGGWQVGNVDATIIAQQPRLAPYLDEMRQRVGEALGVETSRISVKAKSSNGMGPEGKGESMSAQAVALIEAAP